MLLRTLLLLLAVIGGYAVETPVLGSGNPPASGSIFPGGVIPSNTQVVYSNGTTLQGDAGLIRSGTAGAAVLIVGDGTGAPGFRINGATATARDMVYQTAGSNRWIVRCDATVEGGSNAGSNFDIISRDDSGVQIDVPFQINRAAGTNIILQRPVSHLVTDAITNTISDLYTIGHLSSGTVANSFGTRILFNLADDGATNRNAGGIGVRWSTAASATRTSQIIFQTVNSAAALATGMAINGNNITISSGFPLTISDTTASTTTGTGCLILSGGMGSAGQVTCAGVVSSGNIQASGFRIRAAGSVTSADATGIVSFWRSGGTIGTAGDFVLQSDLAADANFVFRNGITTPQTVMTIGSAVAAGTTPGVITSGTSTITGGVTDGYTTSHRFTPIYNGAFTVTRHNYMDINQITGTSTITDAPLFRFDAAIGTHKTVNSGTTKTSPGTVTAWIVININGTLHYIPCYASKTSMVSPIERAVRATIAFPTVPCERISYASAEAA